ncbi:hypothetical protein NCAS_0B08750 [Naumovozyma castellii]|uniref:Uncharacterized protein n=1 Tax=Naumovozyma castellii TaxID=27288 RepID=G0VAT2_NAUCA|nr:hypothetical protein NCAS_0B08750 [Naumovozyma castellii CBS 4309]CCC68959.1 hypothetical protein NCAS_0B08750 [Naumovozyma castellii CBS 4309]
MIPPPTDPALLRENAFQETGDLNIVLNKDTFRGAGGYKPILTYGLGFFNYGMTLDDDVYSRTWADAIRCHVTQHCVAYTVIFIVLAICWIMLVFMGLKSTEGVGKRKFRNDEEGQHSFHQYEDDESKEYHHVKV